MPPAPNNYIVAGKRPMSSMSTTIAVDDQVQFKVTMKRKNLHASMSLKVQNLLKRLYHEFFITIFCLTNPSGPLIDLLNHFCILLRFLGDICISNLALDNQLFQTLYFIRLSLYTVSLQNLKDCSKCLVSYKSSWCQ